MLISSSDVLKCQIRNRTIKLAPLKLKFILKEASGAYLVDRVEAELDLQLGVVTLTQHTLVCERQEADLVQGVTGITDELPQENVLKMLSAAACEQSTCSDTNVAVV